LDCQADHHSVFKELLIVIEVGFVNILSPISFLVLEVILLDFFFLWDIFKVDGADTANLLVKSKCFGLIGL
jgi:hypothetical protein